MATTLIIDHPWKESFNHGILNRLVEGLEQDQKIYQIIDLNKDGFDPVMKEEERRAGSLSKRFCFRSFSVALYEFVTYNNTARSGFPNLVVQLAG